MNNNYHIYNSQSQQTYTTNSSTSTSFVVPTSGSYTITSTTGAISTHTLQAGTTITLGGTSGTVSINPTNYTISNNLWTFPAEPYESHVTIPDTCTPMDAHIILEVFATFKHMNLVKGFTSWETYDTHTSAMHTHVHTTVLGGSTGASSGHLVLGGTPPYQGRNYSTVINYTMNKAPQCP